MSTALELDSLSKLVFVSFWLIQKPFKSWIIHIFLKILTKMTKSEHFSCAYSEMLTLTVNQKFWDFTLTPVILSCLENFQSSFHSTFLPESFLNIPLHSLFLSNVSLLCCKYFIPSKDKTLVNAKPNRTKGKRTRGHFSYPILMFIALIHFIYTAAFFGVFIGLHR